MSSLSMSSTPLLHGGLEPVALAMQYQAVRGLSVDLVAPLSDADASAQSMSDTSPTKWHLAHTTWFFESFVLRDYVAHYRLYDVRYPYLFNSYYDAEGSRHARARRGLLTRPSLADVLAWRATVDAALLECLADLPSAGLALVELGIAHEQQHQELLLTDILHLFAQNPLAPAVWPTSAKFPFPLGRESLGESLARPDVLPSSDAIPRTMQWIAGVQGVVEIGHDPNWGSFAFDCETPRHSVFLAPHALAHRTVTNSEWQEFIADGGYDTASLWLSDGWDWRQAEAISAPAYWRDEGLEFTLAGLRPRAPDAPTSHISFYEADAFARWAGARLPSEAEWEAMAVGAAVGAVAHDSTRGNQLDVFISENHPRSENHMTGDCNASAHPQGRGDSIALDHRVGDEKHAQATRRARCEHMFGDVWEWTGSAYRPYPSFCVSAGAVGEYNGKFMSNQFTLRGGSCATPRGHMRASYRNFFYPHQRWQFTGVRLAKDV